MASRRPTALARAAWRRLHRSAEGASGRSAVGDGDDDPATGHIVMGPYSYGQPLLRSYLGDTATVQVGAFVSIADNVEFIPGGNHRVDWISTYPFRLMLHLPGALRDGHPGTKGDIVVGNDVWIATGARILSGVTIGDGAVVAAGAIVTKDVRPYSIVAGSPATEVRRRFSDDHIAVLQELRWWEWPIEAIIANVAILSSGDVEALLEAAHGIRSG